MTRNKNEAMTEIYLIPKELLKKTIKYINDAGIINLKELSKLYKIKTDKEPLNVIIDPNMWVLKNHTLKKIKSS